MARQTVWTNREDLYLEDANKIGEVVSWLQDVKKGNDRIESFIKRFPDDVVVVEYLEDKSKKNLEALTFHVSVIESQLPLEKYFDVIGITNNALISKLFKLIESKDEKIAIEALRLAFKVKFPEAKPVRITPTMNQHNYFLSDDEREALIKKITNKGNDGNSNIRDITDA